MIFIKKYFLKSRIMGSYLKDLIKKYIINILSKFSHIFSIKAHHDITYIGTEILVYFINSIIDSGTDIQK